MSTRRAASGVEGALLGGLVLLFAGDRGSVGASLLADALVFVSALLLAERQIYLARAVQLLDPVKLQLAQATVGGVSFIALSALSPERARRPVPHPADLRRAGRRPGGR